MMGRQKDLESIFEEERRKLESISGMSAQEAKEMLLSSVENEARHDAALIVKKIETEAREIGDRKAKDIISMAIQRYSGDYVAEKTVSVVTLPNEEMKGRIIGREGRNIRAIEASTGVDLIIDDTPEAVILSGFNPVRREVARVSLERLISDGRIHPARIEEIVEKVTAEIETSIREAGELAAFDVGVHGIHPELIKLIGKLKFRTSYAQNVLQHAREVAFLCGIMAAELGLNEKQAKRAGLLHDIGKAVDHEMEGPHAAIGSDLARRYGESPAIVHAIAAHHEDIAAEDVMAVLVQAADALSGARPGARKELLETYVRRLEELETDCRFFQRNQQSLRNSGWQGAADYCREQHRCRCRRRASQPRHSQENRKRAHLSRTDQDYGHSGNEGSGIREISLRNRRIEEAYSFLSCNPSMRTCSIVADL